MEWWIMQLTCCRRAFDVQLRLRIERLTSSYCPTETGRVTSHTYVPCVSVYAKGKRCAKSDSRKYSTHKESAKDSLLTHSNKRVPAATGCRSNQRSRTNKPNLDTHSPYNRYPAASHRRQR